MAGYSNSPCRKIFSEYGSDGSVSEFVYSRAILCGAKRVFEKLSFSPQERPLGIQIFGSDEFEMADAAQLVEEKLSPDFIDVNFGCPAPNAVGAGAGAALLKNVPQMKKIVETMANRLKIPLTAKMRIGWDLNSIIVPFAALELEQAGAKMITLHGRTRSKAYEGDADWNLIEQTAQALKIPLVGNGSAEKLTGDFLRNSACAGFMIGRAALGNPWIFSQMKTKLSSEDFLPTSPSSSERAHLALRYAELVCEAEFTGISKENLTHAKSQIMRFIKGCEGFKKVRASMRDINSIDELKGLLCKYL